MQEENYQGAVDAFKRSLLNNPNDEETRYNYVLAKELLKNQKTIKTIIKTTKTTKTTRTIRTINKTRTINLISRIKTTMIKKINLTQKKRKKSKKKPEISPQQLKNILEAMNKEEKGTRKSKQEKDERITKKIK